MNFSSGKRVSARTEHRDVCSPPSEALRGRTPTGFRMKKTEVFGVVKKQHEQKKKKGTFYIGKKKK